MDYSTLLYKVENQVAHITLNRPDAANSINAELAGELLDAVLHAEQDPNVRAVLLSGAGKGFCSGGDVKGFLAEGDNVSFYVKRLTADFHAAVARIARMDAPVISAVHGAAAGAGMSLAIACDLVLAAESARFVLAYTGVGLSPDGSSTFYLPRIIGLRRATELALTNRMLSAQQAMDWGLATRVLPDAELMSEANKLAVQLASGPTRAFGAAKQLLRIGSRESLETHMESESESLAKLASGHDAREGFAAFVEKRKPHFNGS